jgi:hypothetical protein
MTNAGTSLVPRHFVHGATGESPARPSLSSPHLGTRGGFQLAPDAVPSIFPSLPALGVHASLQYRI